MTRAYFDVMGAAFAPITENELITNHSSAPWKGPCRGNTHSATRPSASTGPSSSPDTHEAPHFKDSPFVTGPPFIRFYAGRLIQLRVRNSSR